MVRGREPHKKEVRQFSPTPTSPHTFSKQAGQTLTNGAGLLVKVAMKNGDMPIITCGHGNIAEGSPLLIAPESHECTRVIHTKTLAYILLLFRASILNNKRPENSIQVDSIRTSVWQL